MPDSRLPDNKDSLLADYRHAQKEKAEKASNPPRESTRSEPQSLSTSAPTPKPDSGASEVGESNSTITPALAAVNIEQDSPILLEESSTGSKESNEEQTPQPEAEYFLRSLRPPATSYSVWRDYFENDFSSRITEEAAAILSKAAEAASKHRGSINNLITVNTADLLLPLTSEYAPLETLHLERIEAESIDGKPPWYEHQSEDDEISYELRDAFGSTLPSEEFTSLLEAATHLLGTTPEFREVTEWHLAFALILSGPTGFTWQLDAQKSSLRSAAVVLRRNLRNHQPALEPLFPWSDLDLGNDSETAESTEEPDTARDSKVWSRAFDKIRNPKDFKWSISCGQILDKLWQSRGIAASFARQSDRRTKNFNPSLTPRCLFLQCLIHGAQKNITEQDLLARLANTIGKDEEALRKNLQTELHRGSDSTNESNPVATQRLLDVISQAMAIRDDVGKDKYVCTRHLVAALLLPSEGIPTGSMVLDEGEAACAEKLVDELATLIQRQAATSIEELPSNWDKWISRLRNGLTESGTEGVDPDESEESTTGGKHHASRNPHPDELCLDIDRYAAAAAQLLKNASAESDFVFGLFGPWGRGKTTLADKIQEEIEKREYVSIRFCPWKYPTRPELWVHLHEEILHRAQLCLETAAERAELKTPDEPSWLQRHRVSFRVGILNQGWAPLVIGSSLLLVSRLPWLDFSIGVARAIGLSGTFLLILFALRSTQWMKSLRLHYGTLPNHRDKLGLQSVIGKDLSNLLKVWITPDGEPTPKPLKKWWPLWVAAGAVCLACILAAGKIVDHGIQTPTSKPAAPSTEVQISISNRLSEKVGKAITVQVGRLVSMVNHLKLDPLATSLTIGSLLILLGLAVLVFAVLIRINPTTYKKLLLVVDNLDRCEPDQMLAVVESLRVFLDKTEMSRRMQILMLIDDRKLDQAILKRAREQRWHPKSKEERDSYCREQREKYFVISIRLAPLDKSDISEVTSKILDREANESQYKMAEVLRKRQKANERTLQMDENQVSATTVVQPQQIKVDLPLTGKLGEASREVVPEDRRPATEEEMQKQREANRAAKEQARAEETERTRIERELEHRTTRRPPKAIDQETQFTPIERQLLHEWVQRQSDDSTSPRTIRTLITRYLLGRLMISTFGFEPNVHLLIAALSGTPFPTNLGAEERRAYHRVATSLQR